MCVACMRVHAAMYALRPEEDVKCPFLSLSALTFLTESHIEPGTRLAVANPIILLALPLPLSTVVTVSTQLLMELEC